MHVYSHLQQPKPKEREREKKKVDARPSNQLQSKLHSSFIFSILLLILISVLRLLVYSLFYVKLWSPPFYKSFLLPPLPELSSHCPIVFISKVLIFILERKRRENCKSSAELEKSHRLCKPIGPSFISIYNERVRVRLVGKNCNRNRNTFDSLSCV